MLINHPLRYWLSMGLIQVGDFRIGKEERDIVNKVLDSNRISEGKFVKQFEEEWAKFVGTKYSVLFNSGSSALIAGLTALKYNHYISEDSKVITSPLTYIATVNSIVHAGFEPVFVDVDRKNFGITPESIDALPDIKHDDYLNVIMPVHLMGFPCDMDGIHEIADAYGMMVFEDSAQAHGSVYMGKERKGRTGSLSHLSGFSFYVAHNIQVGEMGALNTDDPKIATMARKIKGNGRVCDCITCTRTSKCKRVNEPYDPRFTHDVIGYNFKTTEISAALGLVQLKQFRSNFKKRQENVKYLNEGLGELSDILQLPEHSEQISYLAYPIVIKDPDVVSRASLANALERRGIETRPLFGSIPTQQVAYSHLREKYKGKLPNADFIGSNGFYIGCHQYLEKDDLDKIIDTFRGVLRR
jgi:CDP-6-deoxy-D-xylo-4-hexulose-3-dehydrase